MLGLVMVWLVAANVKSQEIQVPEAEGFDVVDHPLGSSRVAGLGKVEKFYVDLLYALAAAR